MHTTGLFTWREKIESSNIERGNRGAKTFRQRTENSCEWKEVFADPGYVPHLRDMIPEDSRKDYPAYTNF